MTDLHSLHAIATKLDNEFQDALVAVYGAKLASTARYYHVADHDDAEVIRLSVAYREAIKALFPPR
jgi:hypothetical protein